MLTSKVQLGYVLTRGGGQAVQDGLSCPPPRISERMDNQLFLLHHLLQKYLGITDINFISVNLRCSLQRFSWVTIDKGWGASCPGQFILPPTQNFRENWYSPNFITPSATGIFSWKGYKHYFNQSEIAYFKRSVGLHIDKGWGASYPGQFVLPPTQNFREKG